MCVCVCVCMNCKIVKIILNYATISEPRLPAVSSRLKKEMTAKTQSSKNP